MRTYWIAAALIGLCGGPASAATPTFAKDVAPILLQEEMVLGCYGTIELPGSTATRSRR